MIGLLIGALGWDLDALGEGVAGNHVLDALAMGVGLRREAKATVAARAVGSPFSWSDQSMPNEAERRDGIV